MNIFTILILIVWILSAVITRITAIKRGADSLAWSVTGWSLGPFALPFLIFCKKKKDSIKSEDK